MRFYHLLTHSTVLLYSKKINNNCRLRLQPIKRLNIYFTLLRVYYMFILNYITFKIRKNTTTSVNTTRTQEASKQPATKKVSYTPRCASGKSNKKKGSSSSMTKIAARVSSNADVTVKANSSSSNTCQQLNYNNNNNNNNKCQYVHKERKSMSVCEIFAMLQQRFINIFVYIKLLMFEYIANCCISMQIESTKIAATTATNLPITHTANGVTSSSNISPKSINRTTKANTKHSIVTTTITSQHTVNTRYAESSANTTNTAASSKKLAVTNVTYTPECISSKKNCKNIQTSSSSSSDSGSGIMLAAKIKSKAKCNQFLTVKPISSTNTCQRLNSHKNYYKFLCARTKQRICRVFVLLYYMFIYIKWLVCENIANYFISMQIESAEIATTTSLYVTNNASINNSTTSLSAHKSHHNTTLANNHHTNNISNICNIKITPAISKGRAKATAINKIYTSAKKTRRRTRSSDICVNHARCCCCGGCVCWSDVCDAVESCAANYNSYALAFTIWCNAKSSSICFTTSCWWWCWWWCHRQYCSALRNCLANFNAYASALTMHCDNARQLKGIRYIRLISFKIKRFLQIPYKIKQSTNIIIKRLKNYLSAIKNHAFVSCRHLKHMCIYNVRRRVLSVLEAFNMRAFKGKVLDLSLCKQTITSHQHTSKPQPTFAQHMPATLLHTPQTQPQSLATPIATPFLVLLTPQLLAQSQSQLSLLTPLKPQLLLPKPSRQPQLQRMLQQQPQQQKQNLQPQQILIHYLLHSYCDFLLCITFLVKSVCLAYITNFFVIGARRCFHWPYRPLSLLQRSFTMLILLSSLWHGTECFHGSVKLTTNTVKTKYGLLRGIVVRSSPLVEAYLGIPYASPPVGSLRFMPPITPSTWKNVRNADRFSAVCPQTVPIPPNGPEALLEVPRARLAQLRRLLPLLSNQSEDCLYLNIYVPYENRRKRRSTSTSNMEHIPDPPSSILATVLLIHGESYEWNSGNPYDGSELAAHGNIIVVTINFRLGILGFLKTGGKESAQGNFGLMDLVAGLHWLKENLPAFGGDPQRITLLGHSTGAALANMLMVSPVASDLVQRAVLVSGSALSPWAIQKNPLFVKRRVAEQTGCHGDMLYDDLAPCLRTKTIAELLAVKIDHPRFLSGFAPFIDGTVISPNADPVGELTLPLGSAIVSTSGIEFANFPKRDLIFCLTSVESYLDLSAQDLEFGFNETRRDRILRTFVRNNFHYHLNEIFAVLKNEYTDWEKAIRSPLSSRDATLSFLSDGHTAAGLIKLGYMHSLHGGRSYFLHFKHRTVEEEYPQRTGSVRGEDVPFWLGLPISPLFPHNYTTQERQISRLMLRYLANFAKTGNPNHSGLETPFISTSAYRSPQLDYAKVKRASLKSLNAVNKYFNLTTLHLLTTPQNGNAVDTLNLALFYNQRRSSLLRDRRAYYKRHLRSNSESNEVKMSIADELTYTERLPFWDAYDVVNQLYLELGNKAEVQSHYRGHKLSMWLNLIPQLHKHANINDQSMRHHQFPEDISNRDLYEGVVRPQLQTKPTDDEDTAVVKVPKSPTKLVKNNTRTGEGNAVVGDNATTECNTDGIVYANVADNTSTQQPGLPSSDNRSVAVEGSAGGSQQKDLATASTGLIGNLEMFRRFNGKQFSDYTTVLVATIAVGCFLLALNILIFAGIYHQREKRARDAKTKEELQDPDTSKNSSILKLNALAAAAADDDGFVHFDGISGKSTVLFGEYNYYDEKPKSGKEKLLVDLTPVTHTTTAHLELKWPGGGGGGASTSTLDLLKTKHHHTHSMSVEMPIFGGSRGNLSDIQCLQELGSSSGGIEMATYSGGGGTHTVPCAPDLAILETVAMPGRRSSFAAIPSGSLTSMQFDYAVQSSDQLSFKDIEDAVKASTDDLARDIMDDDDIPEPPPPPRSFQNVHHLQQQQLQQLQQPAQLHQHQTQAGILRPSGSSTLSSTTGKKRVHIQEISV
ncbi:uncharacterized protein Nlg2 [Eurosta solidaginis]|uniref:uncharacterized protein Nlg2 n=1 Tax=Eurosta solidaginis TaxID=178769 RepID=UPI003531454B